MKKDKYKQFILQRLYTYGDTYITMKSGMECLVTTDMTSKYIKNERSRLEKIKHKFKVNSEVQSYLTFKNTRNLMGLVKVFNWSSNSFELLNVYNIKKFIPLNKILDNKPRED